MVEEVRSHLTSAGKEPEEADTALGAHEQLAAGEAPTAQEVVLHVFPASIALNLIFCAFYHSDKLAGLIPYPVAFAGDRSEQRFSKGAGDAA